MNKSEMLEFAESTRARAVLALLENKDSNGKEFKGSTQRYAYVAGMQSTLVDLLVEYIRTH